MQVIQRNGTPTKLKGFPLSFANPRDLPHLPSNIHGSYYTDHKRISGYLCAYTQTQLTCQCMYKYVYCLFSMTGIDLYYQYIEIQFKCRYKYRNMYNRVQYFRDTIMPFSNKTDCYSLEPLSTAYSFYCALSCIYLPLDLLTTDMEEDIGRSWGTSGVRMGARSNSITPCIEEAGVTKRRGSW